MFNVKIKWEFTSSPHYISEYYTFKAIFVFPFSLKLVPMLAFAII